MLKDKVEGLIKETRSLCADQPNAQAVEEQLGYFVDNVQRMQYGTFRAKGYFIGSGVVEAGCKTVIGARCKQSGMFWSESGAENILALRCIHSSRRLDQFWKDRSATLLAIPELHNPLDCEVCLAGVRWSEHGGDIPRAPATRAGGSIHDGNGNRRV